MINLKKIKQLTVAILFLLGFGGIYFLIRLSSPTQDSVLEVPTVRDNLRSLTPGESTINDLESTMGEPVKSEDNVYEYPTTSNYRFHEVKVENERVRLIKETVTHLDEIYSTSLTEKYGEAEFKLYNVEKYRTSFILYVYPKEGVAYIGHHLDTTVLEIWYFPPLDDINEFQKQYAPEFTFEPEEVHFD